MRLSHTDPVRSASCDDPNLLAAAGLVPVMALAEPTLLSRNSPHPLQWNDCRNSLGDASLCICCNSLYFFADNRDYVN